MRIVVCEEHHEYRVRSDKPVKSPAQAAAIYGELALSGQESFVVLCLSTRYNLIAAEVIGMGTLDMCAVSPRDVFRVALCTPEGKPRGTRAVVLVHHHPSGDTAPSANDLAVTRRMVEAGKIMDIPVLDHVIVGVTADGVPSWRSLREEGLEVFTE